MGRAFSFVGRELDVCPRAWCSAVHPGWNRVVITRMAPARPACENLEEEKAALRNMQAIGKRLAEFGAKATTECRGDGVGGGGRKL